MNQILEFLNKMKDLQIVRFFSQFFSEDSLGSVLNLFKGRLDSGGGAGLARELLVWAILLAVGTFVIDQVFYWTSPGQVEQARNTWKSFTDGVMNLGASARVLIERARGVIQKRKGLPHHGGR